MRIKYKNTYLNCFWANNMFKPFEFSKYNYMTFDTQKEAEEYLDHIELEILNFELDKKDKEKHLKTLSKFVIVD